MLLLFYFLFNFKIRIHSRFKSKLYKFSNLPIFLLNALAPISFILFFLNFKRENYFNYLIFLLIYITNFLF